MKRGQLLASREKLASTNGLSEKNVRTALNNLKKTNELAIESSRQGTVITVINYDLYQPGANEAANQKANEGPTRGQQGASNKNVKKEKKEKKLNIHDLDYSSWPTLPEKEFLNAWEAARKNRKLGQVSQRIIERLAKELNQAVANGFSPEQCFDKWEVKGWGSFEAGWMHDSDRQSTTKKTGQDSEMEAWLNGDNIIEGEFTHGH